jgi:hypothetical protein
MQGSDAGNARGRGGVRVLLLAAIGLLYVVSIPWYRETGAEPEIWFGLPDWVAVALGCYVAVAVLNAIAWLRTDVPEPPSAADEP